MNTRTDGQTRLSDAALAQLFTEARTRNAWLDRAVDPALLEELYSLSRWGPTAANSNPARFLFITSQAGKQRLERHLSPGNVEKTMTAPVCVVVAWDTQFYDFMPQLFPSRDMKAAFVGKPEVIVDTAGRSAKLQGAYMMLAARSVGLDVGPMSGFNRETLDADFFPDGRWKSDFLFNLGYGSDENLFERNPRLSFDQACRIV